jgi:uncharacterized protein YkwD
MRYRGLEKVADTLSIILIGAIILGVANPSASPQQVSPLFETNHAFFVQLLKLDHEKPGKDKTFIRLPNITSILGKRDPFSYENDRRAFDYLNEIRQKNDRKVIAWDSNIYELAKFRATDMYERGYFDHVTPDGKCAENYAAQFNAPRVSLAENLFATTGYASGINAVDSWMKSRGHRYALLYPTHRKGAIACGYGFCVFLAAGLESWECVTGEEGLDYWRTAPHQPFEIP